MYGACVSVMQGVGPRFKESMGIDRSGKERGGVGHSERGACEIHTRSGLWPGAAFYTRPSVPYRSELPRRLHAEIPSTEPPRVYLE